MTNLEDQSLLALISVLPMTCGSSQQNVTVPAAIPMHLSNGVRPDRLGLEMKETSRTQATLGEKGLSHCPFHHIPHFLYSVHLKRYRRCDLPVNPKSVKVAMMNARALLRPVPTRVRRKKYLRASARPVGAGSGRRVARMCASTFEWSGPVSSGSALESFASTVRCRQSVLPGFSRHPLLATVFRRW